MCKRKFWKVVKRTDVMKVECIICFASTSQAIMAEQELLEKGVAVRVMPKPSSIEAGCGFCLRFLPHDRDKAILFLTACGINVKETYLTEESGGNISYGRVPVAASA
jgi:hypothetical protein